MEIGKKIRNAREDLDLSQEEVARLVPMNQSSYSKIERDIQEPNMDQLRRICQILHLNAQYLLALDEYSEAQSDDVKFAKDVRTLYQKYFEK